MPFLFIALSLLTSILLIIIIIVVIQYSNNSILAGKIAVLRTDLEKADTKLTKSNDKIERKLEKAEVRLANCVEELETKINKRMEKVEIISKSNDETIRRLWGTPFVN